MHGFGVHTAGVTFGIVFLLVALAFVGAALAAIAAGVAASLAGAVGVCALAWTAVACLLASIGWLLPTLSGASNHRVRWIFGKRDDGTRTWWSTVLLLPFLGPVWGYWNIRRPRLTEAPWHELLPDLVIGRRLLDREFDLEVDHLVDLTCEYAERPMQRRHPGYLCLPIVDGAAPPPAVLHQYVEKLQQLEGRIYLHCAEGHGRTATVAAAMLLARGLADDVDEALARITAIRPKAQLYAGQMRVLRMHAESTR